MKSTSSSDHLSMTRVAHCAAAHTWLLLNEHFVSVFFNSGAVLCLRLRSQVVRGRLVQGAPLFLGLCYRTLTDWLMQIHKTQMCLSGNMRWHLFGVLQCNYCGSKQYILADKEIKTSENCHLTSKYFCSHAHTSGSSLGQSPALSYLWTGGARDPVHLRGVFLQKPEAGFERNFHIEIRITNFKALACKLIDTVL